jgi:hypothetical protein
LGYLEPSHYNFPKLEKRHYYSRILKFAIAILDFPQIYHKIRMKTTRAQLQVYRKTYISLYLCYPLNDMRAPLVYLPLPPIFSSPFLLLFSCVSAESGSGDRSWEAWRCSSAAGPATGVRWRGEGAGDSCVAPLLVVADPAAEDGEGTAALLLLCS